MEIDTATDYKTEIENYITEYHTIDEFLPQPPRQDALWWYQHFDKFDSEVYILLDYICKGEVEEDVLHLLTKRLKAKQDKLVEAFERGGRKLPDEEEIPADEFIYLTTNKNELDPTGDISQQ